MRAVSILPFLLLMFGTTLANNLQITNIELKNQNTVNNTYVIEFDVAWMNSWRTPTLETNWDAVYFFVKYRQLPSATWSHGTLELTGESIPTAATIQYTGGGKGGLLYKSSSGIGSNNWDNIQIIWNYGVDGMPDDQPVEISVLGFEMVYIPQGSFHLGDNGTEEVGNFRNADNQDPFHVTSESALTLGGVASGSIAGDGQVDMIDPDDFSSAVTKTLPTSYPKGFNPFYVMKYEMSQDAYVEFLNKLEPAQAINRFADNYNDFNNTIDDSGTDPIYTTDTPDRAVNYTSYKDASAYADWAAMRLMSEFEFEKICRGPLPPLANEFATGSSIYSTTPWVISNAAMPDESITNPDIDVSNLMIHDNNTSGPLRCGIMAASAINSTREESGSSYYGAMEMSGNLYELVINVGTSEGRNYTSHMGDGALDTNGDHNETAGGWPSVTSSNGSGVKGGSYAFGTGLSVIRARVSNRDLVNLAINNRFSDVGLRLVVNDF